MPYKRSCNSRSNSSSSSSSSSSGSSRSSRSSTVVVVLEVAETAALLYFGKRNKVYVWLILTCLHDIDKEIVPIRDLTGHLYGISKGTKHLLAFTDI